VTNFFLDKAYSMNGSSVAFGLQWSNFFNMRLRYFVSMFCRCDSVVYRALLVVVGRSVKGRRFSCLPW
jgi:hypothetical protein